MDRHQGIRSDGKDLISYKKKSNLRTGVKKASGNVFKWFCLGLLQAPIFTSFYIVHLLEWLKAFPREQILIFRNEDYTVDIKGTMTDIFRFLDVGECSSVVHTDAKSK
ncbi:hypothetical protein DPMN_106955 [Dreissena polymorpha]|uniref:Sulfotransferase domain-containing protein n=1 Tax=Dreissena polymorpha TaxID=45954 RepID=A0A9D4QKJ3_DREPO|nr:hypothetical protein DPMN_106955 [Dreissena polymorpha]